MRVENIEVAFLKKSIIASGLPCKHDDEKEDDYLDRLGRAKILASNSSNTGHANFLKGIRVAFDITCSHAMIPQLFRYHFIDTVSSQSKMYCITKFDVKKQCNEYVTEKAIENLNECIKEYNNEVKNKSFLPHERKVAIIEAMKKCIYNTPIGFELKMQINTNYMQLRNMYHQREDHKLDNEWGILCNEIKKLPLADIFITNKH